MQTHKDKEHKTFTEHLVAYAPVIFFVVLVIGVVVHVNFPIGFVSQALGWALGVAALLLSPVLIIWAQQVRHTLYIPVEDRTCGNFYKGPYKFSRNPTYLSLFLLLFGLAFLINSFILFLMTIVLGPLFTFIIVPEEEHLLEELCKKTYLDYKKRVRMWF